MLEFLLHAFTSLTPCLLPCLLFRLLVCSPSRSPSFSCFYKLMSLAPRRRRIAKPHVRICRFSSRRTRL
ncbi:hypothetical protein SCHPADRAFT_344756 [Schizopora paradoxa]|uniref:Secreted protein n=1 Tax=Schizopora paradoxa TaxID=27342 RepID=A0A0H2RWE0_9AGAM|nr:hypothetical protein SCHPADRAFT_344756 [Schizopora paradoxa]